MIVLARLLEGLDAIGCPRDQALGVVTKAALDSIPALRRAVLSTLGDFADLADTNLVAEAVRHPAQTTRRALEDLVAHGLVECTRQGEGKAHLWTLSTFARERIETFPETSGHTKKARRQAETGDRNDESGSPTISRSAYSTTFRESPSGELS